VSVRRSSMECPSAITVSTEVDWLALKFKIT
jgi:hypothetical protein